MTPYYEVDVVKTLKAFGPYKSMHSSFAHNTEKFSSIEEAREWVSEEYCRPCKKVKFFVNDSDGSAQHCGWVYCFKDDVENVWRQDWVSIVEINSKYVL